MRIIAVANQKGGCGKTTTAINLAASLSRLRKNVLLIDLDPQGHATLGLNIKPQDVAKSIYDVLSPVAETKVRIDEVVLPISANFDLVPANILLSAVEQELSGRPEREAKLFQAISLMASPKTYDFILIDCPPSLGLLTFNALRAAQELIAPVDTGFFALHGITKLLEIKQLIEQHSDTAIAVKALLTMYDGRTKFAQEIKREIEQCFNGQIFKTVIHATIKVREASSFGLPVIAFDKQCKAAEDYQSLARELCGETDKKLSIEQTMQTIVNAGSGPQRLNGAVLFAVRAPAASSVEIAGDFNEWAAGRSEKLEQSPDGVWAKMVPLTPGRYRYKFIVDGQWVTDPHNATVERDESGNVNSLLEFS
ncbi:MAG: AAA family ATPase [Candidatus Omnitrophica bacterium]|nr:AAA family ATPase [Candidatus Omnitrophota bacterium]